MNALECLTTIMAMKGAAQLLSDADLAGLIEQAGFEQAVVPILGQTPRHAALATLYTPLRTAAEAGIDFRAAMANYEVTRLIAFAKVFQERPR